MRDDISIEEVEELEQQQLDRYEELGLEPVDYSDGSLDHTFLISDLVGHLSTLNGNDDKPFPGSRYDHPAYRKKMSRFCSEFVTACTVGQDVVEVPILGIWPGKVPGGFYGDLPESGRALLLFTEGAFSFFSRIFHIVAGAYPFGFDGFDSKEAASCDVEQWVHMPSAQSAFEPFRIAMLDLIIKKESDELRRDLHLPSKFDPPITFAKGARQIALKEIQQGAVALNFEEQCFRYLFGHEFAHILFSRGVLDIIDSIPPFILLPANIRGAYNLEINCDVIGVESAISYAKASGLEPEFGYAGVYLFFAIWHLVCRAVWRLQFTHEPAANEPIYMKHPPTLLREHYAFDIMTSMYSPEEAFRAMKFRLGLLRILENFWDKLEPILDNLRERGVGGHIEPDIADGLNPFFTAPYQRPFPDKRR